MPSSPPLPHRAAAPAPQDTVRPVAIVSLLVCALMLVWFVGQTALMWPLSTTAAWQTLVTLAADNDLPASLQWMLRHPVLTSGLLAAACVPSLLASWGLYRVRRWGLWSFVVLLVVSGLANLLFAGWVDAVLADLIGRIHEADLHDRLQAQRLILALTLYGGSLAVLVLQLWYAWRLLRPDVRARFRAGGPADATGPAVQ